jgi:hypothetical protein
MDPMLRDEIAAACREHDRLMAQRTSEPTAVQRDAAQGLLVFKTRDDALTPADETNEKNSVAWNDWIRAHIEAERDFLLKAMAEGMSQYVHSKLTERDRTISELRAELIEVKGMLSSALTALDAVRNTAYAIVQERVAEKRERQIRDETIRDRSARIADLQRENTASYAKLAAQQLDQSLGQRDSRIALLETQVRMLCQFLSVSGYDLPRGT